MEKIYKGVSTKKLSHAVQWYFNKENLDEASNRIISEINQLILPTIFKNAPDNMYTSSDGQKFNVSVPSIIASHSHKYFGTGRGVTVYGFVDEYGLLY